jgi:hypothetical protein
LPPDDQNLIVHEPLVLYEVTGGTLLGAYDLQMTVYADGIVHLNSAVMFGERPRAVVAYVGAAAARDLASQLERAGAFQVVDQSLTVTDVPLHTLTILRAATDARAHTHSWWLYAPPNQEIPALLHEFIARNFPQF